MIEESRPETLTETGFNGHSMVGPLKRVLVCSPRAAGWNQPDRRTRWQELGFHHALDFDHAQSQHDALCRELQSAGAELFQMPSPPDCSLDAVYTHDASLPTDFGLIVMRPGKPNRIAEGPRHAAELAAALRVIDHVVIADRAELERLAAVLKPLETVSLEAADRCRARQLREDIDSGRAS